jgi:hypothetical protein
MSQVWPGLNARRAFSTVPSNASVALLGKTKPKDFWQNEAK